MTDFSANDSEDELENPTDNLPMLGHKVPRAKPILLTFYDRLQDYPYTTTFYVREETSNEQAEKLIKAITDISACVLGKYKIGYQEFLVPDFRDKVKFIKPDALGTFKWAIKYYARTYFGDQLARSVTIPGRNHDTSLLTTRNVPKKAGKRPDPNHPLWINLTEIFLSICVSKEGMAIDKYIELDYTDSNWPPKGAKKRR